MSIQITLLGWQKNAILAAKMLFLHKTKVDDTTNVLSRLKHQCEEFFEFSLMHAKRQFVMNLRFNFELKILAERFLFIYFISLLHTLVQLRASHTAPFRLYMPLK